MENWKEIEWSNGKLLVSDQGRVRSLLRDGRILKSTPDKKGYHRIAVTIDREKYHMKLHREVAAAFVPNPHSLPQVNHIDGNKNNNAACNLEWVSNLENAKHAISSGLWENVFKASSRTNEARKTPIIAINVETGERRFFSSMSEAERVIGTKHINAVLKGQRTQAHGYRFERG